VRTVLSENNVKTSEIKIHKAICVHILKACILQNEIIFLNEKKNHNVSNYLFFANKSILSRKTVEQDNSK
jgi:hypothetical protein